MRSSPECEEQNSDKKIVLQENKSKITFLNPNQDKILVITVDGCVIDDDETPRCDYAIVPCDEVEIYVELKGNDVYHAVKQIESTISLLSDNPKKINKLCFVISTRVPKQTTSIQQLQSQFKKKFNASLRIKNIQDAYDLRDCIV
jgi:DNA polymerase III sliding clamp (beta) subunit (PCNA family)